MEDFMENVLISLIAILVRCAVSLNSYSGTGKPPMFGDFEAQRHWMEITLNLPMKDWYFNTTQNDLQYWGLDYPPLTAYHSYINGFVARLIDPSWVELGTSRGLESASLKLFMRLSVLVVDVLIYFPAVFLYFKQCEDLSHVQKKCCALVMLLYPGLILIDYGHFQYNCVSLGLTLWAVVLIGWGCSFKASVAFVLALNYKQMQLFHAMPFFCFLLGSAFNRKEKLKNMKGIVRLFLLSIVVTATFALCWVPFIQHKATFLQVLHRIFPVARGIYEDKVANFWCSISIIYKFKEVLTTDQLVKLCLAVTSLALLPSSLRLLRKPTTDSLKSALVNASLIFFLFSYHTHEKSIIIPAMSVCLLIPYDRFFCLWFFLISTFSMLPLLIKDQLVMPYIGGMILIVSIMSAVFPEKLSPVHSSQSLWPRNRIPKALFIMSQLGCVTLTIISLVAEPPAHLPDLWPLLVSVYSAGHLILFLFYIHWLQWTGLSQSYARLREKLASEPNWNHKKDRKQQYKYGVKQKLAPEQKDKAQQRKFIELKKKKVPTATLR